MIKLKNIISFFVSVALIAVVIINKDYLVENVRKVIFSNREVVPYEANIWKKDYGFKYFNQTDEFMPKSYDDVVNIFYTTLNNGWEEFTFYCDVDYEDCLDDVSSLSFDEKFLAEMNNYVHPYNGYTTIITAYDDTGEVNIKIDKLYSNEEIAKIDHDIDNLMNEYLNDDMTLKEKIKKMHDVIINNTKYDEVRADTNYSDYDSARITGLLYDHYAICSGYTDTMAVILSKLDVKNFKVASDNHVWNALQLDGKWYHLDLTWDDPLTSSGRDVLYHTYFLVDDTELTKLNMKESMGEHTYNRDIYLEFRN